MPISISMIVLGSQLVLPVADGVPKFDIVAELQARRRRYGRAHRRSVGQELRQRRKQGEATAGRPVVEIPGAKPG